MPSSQSSSPRVLRSISARVGRPRLQNTSRSTELRPSLKTASTSSSGPFSQLTTRQPVASSGRTPTPYAQVSRHSTTKEPHSPETSSRTAGPSGSTAGGVTVSYFEWIKNLSHIRFGRMDRRLDELRGGRIVELVETMVGRKVPDYLADRVKQGADELDLIRSGLDDTMRRAYQEIREVWYARPQVKDLRTAAYVVAVEKIARSYLEMGI